jgi:RNA-directed DNA polymerase
VKGLGNTSRFGSQLDIEDELQEKTKPFNVAKSLLWESWRRVKANQGAEGIDEQTIEDFESDVSKQLYRIWNRVSSGSYFPPAVKAVPIPKKSGGVRLLGIPTVADRVAQTAVALVLEQSLEPLFDDDSYGYRPGKSAQDAIGITRQRCWQYDWVIEYDIKGLFDNINHDLLLKALRHHCTDRWILLLVDRWLTAPLQDKDGRQQPRTVGTPQGGPLSPVLANLFLHYALDHWLRRNHPSVPFCRYADDGILHCTTETEAKQMLMHLDARLRECGLELHPEKTRIVYCKDANRRGKSEHVQFDFLGYTFRPRTLKNRHGELFTSFAPAMSRSAAKSIRQKVRRWRLHSKSMHSLEALAEMINPTVRGWIGYFCRYHQWSFGRIERHLDIAIVRWAMRKYKRLRGHKKRTHAWLAAKRGTKPSLFAHWSYA